MSWYASLAGILAFIVAGPFIHGIGQADDAPITRNVPIPDFQNPNDTKSYDFDTTPQGLFLSIQFAEGFEDEIGYRRSNRIVSPRFVRLYDLQTAPASGIVPGVRPVLSRGGGRSRPEDTSRARYDVDCLGRRDRIHQIGFPVGCLETRTLSSGNSRRVARQRDQSDGHHAVHRTTGRSSRLPSDVTTL